MNDEEVGLVPAGVDPNEIAMLEARLASAGADLEAAEQIWAELFASQSEFQTRYWTEVGSLVVAIAEAKEELLLLEENREAHRETPDNVDTSDDYADQAAEAQELRDEYKKWAAEEPDPDQPTVPLDEDQERELKDLYKKAAKRWHPDHADPDDDADREWRNDMMIKANELKRVKAQVVSSQVFQRDSIYYQAQQIGSLEIAGYPHQTMDTMIRKLRQVTPEQVQAVAKKYLIDDSLTVAVLDPQPLDAAKPAAPAEARHVQ